MTRKKLTSRESRIWFALTFSCNSVKVARVCSYVFVRMLLSIVVEMCLICDSRLVGHADRELKSFQLLHCQDELFHLEKSKSADQRSNVEVEEKSMVTFLVETNRKPLLIDLAYLTLPLQYFPWRFVLRLVPTGSKSNPTSSLGFHELVFEKHPPQKAKLLLKKDVELW